MNTVQYHTQRTKDEQLDMQLYKQESRAVARKPRYAAAAAVLFGSKFADNIHYVQA